MKAATSLVSFGTLLKQHRHLAALTQAELAARAGYSVVYISKLERGERVPLPVTVAVLAQVLALAPADLARLETAAALARTRRGPPALPPLVGRMPERGLLGSHLAGQGPPLLVLAGEPGIGKTRLLQEAAGMAEQGGWTVLAAGCHRKSGQEPYAPLVGALAHWLEPRPPLQQRQALAGCAWLGRLLPELAESGLVPAPAWTLPPEQERRLLFMAVRRFLDNVAGPAGTLLVLDDVHWAGEDALDLMQFLTQGAAAPPLRLVTAYRSTQVRPSDSLGMLLADLATAGLVMQHPVGPLAPEDAQVLLQRLLEGSAVADRAMQDQVLARAEGVPFFLVSCVQALRASSPATPDAVPWKVEESIGQRVAALSPGAEELLEAAAIIGRVSERAVLLASGAPGREAAETLAALDALSQGQLLVEEGAAAYRFAHDLIREVVLAHLSAARRQHWHRRVLAALEQHPGSVPPERLAYHATRAGDPEKAVVYLERAGDRAETVQAHTEALHAYQEALAQGEALDRLPDRARLQRKVGQVLTTLARYDEALAVLEQAVNNARTTSDQEGFWQALAQLGRVHSRRASYQEGLARLLPVLEPWEDRAWPAALAEVQLVRAELCFDLDQYQEQLRLTTRVVQWAEATSHPDVLVKAKHWRSRALLSLGRLEEGAQEAEGVVALAEASGDLWDSTRLLNSVAGAYWMQGRMEECQHSLARALALAERLGDPAMLAYMLNNLAALHFLLGQWEEARPRWEHAVRLVHAQSSLWGGAYSLLGLAQLDLAEGRGSEADPLIEEGISLATRRENWEALRMAQTALAERDLLAGNPQAAYTRLAPFLDHPSQQGIGRWYFVHLVAWALLPTETERAEALLAGVIREVRDQQHVITLVDLLRVQALLLGQQQRWQEAQTAVEEGLALARSMPYPYAEAKALYVSGLVQVQQGKTQPARERLEAALALCVKLGERLYARQINRVLGHRWKPRT